MTTNPMSVDTPGSATSPPSPRPDRVHAVVLAAEDWFLAGWIALATPLLFRAQGGSGPFDGGAPFLGAIRLAAVLGALIGLAARRDPKDATPGGRSIIERGAVGPLCGGLLLVAIGGFTALDVTSGVGAAAVVAAAVAMFASGG